MSRERAPGQPPMPAGNASQAETGGLALRLMNKIGPTEWAATMMRLFLVPVDTVLQRRSSGRLSVGRGLGVPSLLLTTSGARTGQPRQVPLFYVPHREGYAVVGSNFGLPHHPAWTINLLRHPNCTITTAGQTIPVIARQVEGEEREELWTKILDLASGYQTYNERSGRDLRIFHLQPATTRR
jgi:deazaflavin-dependent oxidoreductase (nitroreductase family)